MIDIRLVRENPESVAENARNKGYDIDIQKLVELDDAFEAYRAIFRTPTRSFAAPGWRTNAAALRLKASRAAFEALYAVNRGALLSTPIDDTLIT